MFMYIEAEFSIWKGILMSDNKNVLDEEFMFEEEINFDGLEGFEDDSSGEENTAVNDDEACENEEAELSENEDKPDAEKYAAIEEQVVEFEAEVVSNENIDEEKEFSSPQKAVNEYAEDIKSEADTIEHTDKPWSNRVYIVNTVISAVTLCAVAAGAALGYKYINSVEKELYSKVAKIDELEKKNRELEADYVAAMNMVEYDNEESEAEALKSKYDDGKIIFYDTTVGYSWSPVLDEVAKNNYIPSKFSQDSRGRLTYTENGEASSYFGIDVSSHQGDIDWQLVKEDNVEFAFLRIGYRGYGAEGNICTDEKFEDNYAAAHDAGIDLGVYFFSQAATVDEAVEEANYLLSVLDGKSLEYPIVFDWETINTGDPEDIPRTEDVTPKTLTLSAIAFCETVRDAGYDAMIYTNKKLATIKYDLRQLSDYPIWLAYYDTNLDYCYDFDIWQYGTGQVDGIEGEVDINIAMIK